MATRIRKHSGKHSGKQSKKQSKKQSHNCYLVPLNKINTKQIAELSVITKDTEVMKYIGKGNIWTIKDINQFVKDERIEAKKNHKNNKNRMYYSFIMICNNQVVGFIAGRKNKNLLPINSSPYNLLMRMFISRAHSGKGFGKLIIKLFIETYSRMIIKKTSEAKLISDIDKDNIASIKIHLANGFQFIDKVKYPNKHNYERYALLL
jgi:predicted acetyltransferase